MFARDLYPGDDGYFGGYQPIIESFGNVLLQVDDDGYQGDSRVLLEKDGRIGLLIFGWGCCSGCDALLACTSYEDVDALIESLQPKWFDDRVAALAYFDSKDWEVEFYAGDETKAFVEQAKELLEETDEEECYD